MAEVTIPTDYNIPPNIVNIQLGLTSVPSKSINFTGSCVRHAGKSFIPNKGKT